MLRLRKLPNVRLIARAPLASPSATAILRVAPLWPVILQRHASNKFPGGQFNGLNIPGMQQPQPGDTLKQYVRAGAYKTALGSPLTPRY